MILPGVGGCCDQSAHVIHSDKDSAIVPAGFDATWSLQDVATTGRNAQFRDHQKCDFF
jgi:enhancing lycopene biosynthesis protein 2